MLFCHHRGWFACSVFVHDARIQASILPISYMSNDILPLQLLLFMNVSILFFFWFLLRMRQWQWWWWRRRRRWFFFFHIVFTGRCRWGEWMMRSIPFTWLKKMIRLVSSTCDYLTPNYTVHSSIKSKYDDDGQRRRVAADSREVTGLDGGW